MYKTYIKSIINYQFNSVYELERSSINVDITHVNIKDRHACLKLTYIYELNIYH